MTVAASAGELMLAYEALRARAVGVIPDVTPRGLAVLQRAGMVAWMRALPPALPGGRTGRSAPGATTALVDPRGELVSVLTEMALGAGRSWRGAS